MSNPNIEENIIETVSPLAALLGEERTERLKDRIVDAIVERVVADLDMSDYYIISPDHISDIAGEAFDEVKEKLKKKYKTKFTELVEASLVRIEDAIKGEEK